MEERSSDGKEMREAHEAHIRKALLLVDTSK